MSWRTFLTLIVFWLVAMQTPLHAAEKKICRHCTRPVATSVYVVVGSDYYCENHFICAACNKSIGMNVYKADGSRYYHPACYDSAFAIPCAWCGAAVTGTYTIYDERNYHDTCYDRHVALRCAHCQERIEGEYIYDFWGNKYHTAHQFKEPKCATCERFVSEKLTGGGTKSPDGRWSCGICLKSAITSTEQARSLLEQTRADLLALGIDVPFGEVDLQLLRDRRDFPAKARHVGNAWGYAEYRYVKALYGVLPLASDVTVYVLDNQPEIFARRVIAHELMHLWLFRNGKREAEPYLVEGTCNYIAFKVLEKYAGAERNYVVANMETDKSKDYGEGYRRVRAFAESRGLDAFLAFLKKEKRLPKGY